MTLINRIAIRSVLLHRLRIAQGVAVDVSAGKLEITVEF